MKKIISIISKILLVLLFFILGWGGFIFNSHYLYLLFSLLIVVILFKIVGKREGNAKLKDILSLLKMLIVIVGLPYFFSYFAIRFRFEFECWHFLGFILLFLMLVLIKNKSTTIVKTLFYGFLLILWSIISTILIGCLYFIDGIMNIH